jgi:hypothetical protein
MKVMNEDVVQTQKQTFIFEWTPVQVEGDNWVLTQKIVGVRMDIDIGGNRIVFDSTKEEKDDTALSEFCKALVGSEFRVTLVRGQVKEVEGREKFVKKLAAANAAMDPLVNQIFRDEALRGMAEMAFAALREGRVRPGDSWTRKGKQDLSPWGEYWTTFRYTYEGTAGPLDRIKVRSTLNNQPFAGGAVGLPFKIKKGEMKGKGAGTIFFDRPRGRMVRLELNQEMVGEMTAVIGDKETKMEVSQTYRTTVRTSEGPPPGVRRGGDDKEEIKRLREENERLRRRLRAIEEALRRGEKEKE